MVKWGGNKNVKFYRSVVVRQSPGAPLGTARKRDPPRALDGLQQRRRTHALEQRERPRRVPALDRRGEL